MSRVKTHNHEPVPEPVTRTFDILGLTEEEATRLLAIIGHLAYGGISDLYEKLDKALNGSFYSTARVQDKYRVEMIYCPLPQHVNISGDTRVVETERHTKALRDFEGYRSIQIVEK